MNFIENFIENYIAIEYGYNQSWKSNKVTINNNIEDNIFKSLCNNISEPIRNHLEFELGPVYFVNDLESDTIMFKFTEINLVFNTSQSLEYIIKEIKSFHVSFIDFLNHY